MASHFKQELPQAVLVGTPAGQSPNCFGPLTEDKMPNSGKSFYYTVRFYRMWPEYNEKELMPDIMMYQTIEDYMEGKDTILETLRTGK